MVGNLAIKSGKSDTPKISVNKNYSLASICEMKNYEFLIIKSSLTSKLLKQNNHQTVFQELNFYTDNYKENRLV
jgi:hypothetical protein